MTPHQRISSLATGNRGPSRDACRADPACCEATPVTTHLRDTPAGVATVCGKSFLSSRMPGEPLDAPEDLPTEAPRQVALDQVAPRSFVDLRGIVWVIWAYRSAVRASAARGQGRCADPPQARSRTRRRSVRSCQPSLPQVPRSVFATGRSGRGCGHAGRRRSSARSNLESQKAIRIPQPARSSQG